ncbi:hypothetical protein JL720_14596 [Aureococcus anophagefferens]|nr:hypothetical protein JL720_14596 [Aureococcus anophagefferens]
MSHPFAAQDRAVYGMGFYRAHVVGFPDRQRALRDLGFVWERLQPEYNLVARHRRDLLHEAAARHAALAAGAPAPFDDGPTPPPAPPDVDWANFAAPARFAVPRDGEAGAQNWPRRLRGFKLGGSRPARRRAAAAFRRFRRARAYVALEGDADVPQKFVRDAEAAAADAGAAEETKEGDAADVEAPPEPEPEPEPPADDGASSPEKKKKKKKKARDDAEETPAEETEPETEGARELRRLQKEAAAPPPRGRGARSEADAAPGGVQRGASRRRRRCSAATTTRASRRGARAPSPARARSPGRYYGRDRGRDDGRLFATEPFRPQPPAADEAGFPDTPPRFFRDYRRRDFDDDRHRYRSNPPSPYGCRTDPVDGFPAPLRRSAFHD